MYDVQLKLRGWETGRGRWESAISPSTEETWKGAEVFTNGSSCSWCPTAYFDAILSFALLGFIQANKGLPPPLTEQWFNQRKATVNHTLDIQSFPLPLSSPVEVMMSHHRPQTIWPDGPSHHGVLQSHEKKACFVFADLKMDLCCGDKYRKVIGLLICHWTRASKESHNHACHICLQRLSQI